MGAAFGERDPPSPQNGSYITTDNRDKCDQEHLKVRSWQLNDYIPRRIAFYDLLFNTCYGSRLEAAMATEIAYTEPLQQSLRGKVVVMTGWSTMT